MSIRSRKSIYIWSTCIGGIGGVLFLFCFFFMFSNLVFLTNPIYQKLDDFIAFVSLPIFYFIGLIGDDMSIISLILGPPMFVLYWGMLGMGIASGLVWLYFFMSRKCETAANSSEKTEAVDV